MKKLLALILAFAMVLCTSAMASELEGKTTEELIAMIEQLNQELAELKGETPAEPEVTPDPTAVPAYTELAKGSKGAEVQVLQQRLYDLGYLTGGIDGDYGNGTARAVSAFQGQHELPVTGTADVATQELLHSDAAEKAIVYENLDYVGVSRDPSNYTGRYVKFDGRVLQVMEEDSLISFRIATKGNYDNVVYVSMFVPENYSRILEDDRVTVSGTYFDLMTYETVMGASVTIPWIMADLVSLR